MRCSIIVTLALTIMAAPALAGAPSKAARAAKPDPCAYTDKAPTAVRWYCVLNNPDYDPASESNVTADTQSDPSDPYESCMHNFYALAKTRISVAQVIATADKTCIREMMILVDGDGPKWGENRRINWIQTYIRAGAAPSEAFPRVYMQGD